MYLLFFYMNPSKFKQKHYGYLEKWGINIRWLCEM